MMSSDHNRVSVQVSSESGIGGCLDKRSIVQGSWETQFAYDFAEVFASQWCLFEPPIVVGHCCFIWLELDKHVTFELPIFIFLVISFIF